MKNKITINLILVFTISVAIVNGQGQPYAGPDDPAGDIAAEREGTMEGNRVYLYFKNTTELSDWPKPSVSKWPNNDDGVKMVDGIGLLVGGKVYIENNGGTTGDPDTIPLTTPAAIAAASNPHELFFLQTSYREEMDTDPTGTVEWGFYPAFGYFNEAGDNPAMSNKPQSWPVNGWPSGNGLKWQGEWDGRFGRGVIYADMETYFVVNDAQDQEYLGAEDKVQYYPRPGKYIGDINPNVTLQKGRPWGGLGLRVQTRGFQWNNPQARDAIFWEYSIANISDYDITEVALGYWVDNAIGDDGSDELGYFDSQLDMAYSWDINGVGLGGLKTGTMGFAYLESPGLAYDLVDNDQDGLIDEKRDNAPTALIGPTEGIDNLNAFLEFYKLELDDLKEHWDADEDQDWEDGEDLNGDGIYQLTEYAGDDIGLDGVGPGELNYEGPDQGECNHMPDFVEGLGCEPNFNATDVSESDMVGLTAFRMFPIPSHAVSNTTLWFKNDKPMFEMISSDSLEEFEGNISNLVEVFASGPFPLFQGRVERISMSELHSYDPLVGLNSSAHSAPALYELKKIVQVIYEKDYRFAQPPKMPTLTATAGDREVVLTWDNIADTRTRDPFVGNINDFEGYKVYRATDKYMSDAEVITDGYGTPTFLKPIFQCDLKDKKYGFTNFGLINGTGYNLGTDSGITHVFVDNTVQNGRTYYYAVVAYDYGAPNIGPGIAPSENNIVIEKDDAENVVSWGKNVAIVTPHQPAAGYIPPEINVVATNPPIGTGSVLPSILASASLEIGHRYQLEFMVDTILQISNYENGILFANSGLKVYDLTMDTLLIYTEDSSSFSGNNLIYRDTLEYWTINPDNEFRSDVFDGIQVGLDDYIEIPELNPDSTGWVTGGLGTVFHVNVSNEEFKYMPWDYDIVFTGDPTEYTGIITNKSGVRDEDGIVISRNDILVNQAVDFYVVNRSLQGPDGNPELMDMVIQDMNGNGTFELNEDRIIVGAPTGGRWGGTLMVLDFINGTVNTHPTAGDVYRISFKRPFYETDVFQFEVLESEGFDEKIMEKTMKEIRVVPNPYVMTNMMEPAVANQYLNQRRRLLFTNLPAQCTIKIFTVSGVLVDEIDVDNPEEYGIAHWDMLTREDLEIAAGMYIYHVESKVSGEEKAGKFAVIK